MPFVEKIAANDPTFKELRLSESSEHYFSDVSEMVAALGQNTVIDYVRIDRDFLPSLLGEPEKKAAIVIAIGKLPALRELRIMSGPVHANVLGLALNDAANLENLELGAINLKGNQEAIKHLEDALHGHTKLHSFSLANFTVDQEEVSLNDLVRALGTIGSLKKVVLESHKEAKSSFSGDALADLCATNKFEELRIANFRLYPQHYDLISAAVGKSTTLKTLRLNRVGMANPCSIKLATGLKVNSSLTLLDLSSNNIEDSGVTALAEALKENSTLEHLRLWDNKKIGVDGFKALSEMLEANKKITNIDLPSMLDSEYTTKIRDTMMEKKMAQAA